MNAAVSGSTYLQTPDATPQRGHFMLAMGHVRRECRPTLPISENVDMGWVSK